MCPKGCFLAMVKPHFDKLGGSGAIYFPSLFLGLPLAQGDIIGSLPHAEVS